jgi:hypothetical protein
MMFPAYLQEPNFLVEQQQAALVQYTLNEFNKVLTLRQSQLEGLRGDIGDDLFNALTDADRDFIIATEGSVDFGFTITEENHQELIQMIGDDYDE